MNSLVLSIALFLGLTGNVYSNDAIVVSNNGYVQTFQDNNGNLWQISDDNVSLHKNQKVTLYFSDNYTGNVKDDRLFMITGEKCIIVK